MEPFATVEQYVARFGADVDDEIVQECLEDASAAIRAALDERDIDYANPDEEFADRLMRVCRSVANRIVPDVAGGMQNVSSLMETAGPYMQQVSFKHAYGTPKLLPSELELLGVGGGTGRMLRPNAKLSTRGWFGPRWWPL